MIIKRQFEHDLLHMKVLVLIYDIYKPTGMKSAILSSIHHFW